VNAEGSVINWGDRRPMAGIRLMRWPIGLAGRRHGRPAGIGLLTALGVVTLLLGGCSEFNAARQAQQALVRAGYTRARVNVSTIREGQSRQTVVDVSYSSRTGDEAALRAEQDKAAQIVWENVSIRLSAVRVAAITRQVGVPGVGGAQVSRGTVYSREELASRYGPRPARLDKPPSDVPPVATLLLVLVVVGAMVGVVVLIAVLVLRRRRRPLPGAWSPPGQHQPWSSQPQGWPTPGPGWGTPGPRQWPPPHGPSPHENPPDQGQPPSPGSAPSPS
jgi:hypothetical protein